jgi:hypothetical protein
MKGLTSTILRDIESPGYAVSVHRIPSSLLGSVAAFTEMHAVQLAEPNNQHIAKVDGHGEESDYRAACMLAESVGIELEDGNSSLLKWISTDLLCSSKGNR